MKTKTYKDMPKFPVFPINAVAKNIFSSVFEENKNFEYKSIKSRVEPIQIRKNIGDNTNS